MKDGSLWIPVEVMPGTGIQECCEEMAILASRLGIAVEADFNSIRVRMKPGADPRDACRQWDAALQSKYGLKFVVAHPITVPRETTRTHDPDFRMSCCGAVKNTMCSLDAGHAGECNQELPF